MPALRFRFLHRLCLITAGALSCAFPLRAADTAPRERIDFDAGWKFQKGDPERLLSRFTYSYIKPWLLAKANAFTKSPIRMPVGDPGDTLSYVKILYNEPGFDDSEWRTLDLPHDWGIEGPFKQEYPGETAKLPWWGVGWYRKSFEVPASDKGRQLFLDIDGAMSYAVVWVNGKFAGGWPYGYTSFRVDLTTFLNFGGRNTVAIRLDNPPDSSRWYPGGGIYRNVWLVKTGPVHIAHWGTTVTTPQVGRDAATVTLATRVDNATAAAAGVQVRTTLFAHGDGPGAARERAAEPATTTVKIAAGGQSSVTQEIAVKNPRLWDVKSPHLYVAVSEILEAGKIVDRCETTFGIRTIAFTDGRGFLLNGQRVQLNGVCQHHDLGALGAAFNLRAAQRQLETLKEMGVNALRTTHNPPAPGVLDLCDRMGILVMVEAFDCWRVPKKPNGYNQLFDDWAERDLRAMIRRDRNHPSVILWSTGNEIIEQGKPQGMETAKMLVDIVHEEDPTRPATIGVSDTASGYNGFQNAFDVFGFNYRGSEYGKFHAANPGIPIYGSETASTVSSRGEYFFPVSEDKADGKGDFQMSSYDLYAPRWAWTPDTEFKWLDKFPVSFGEFVWTGTDYLGEPTPYNQDFTSELNITDPIAREKLRRELIEIGRIQPPSRSSYFGIVDLAGFKKDRFYIYQARWRPDLPMAHILPHWNWPGREGEVTPVHVYTSGDEAELFLNGKSLGRKKKGAFEYRLRWDDVKYAPGELKTVAFKNGKRWAEDTVRTTGPVATIALQPDRETVQADGKDLVFVTASLRDRNGQLVPRSANTLAFEVSGPAEIVATDNGDPTSHVPFQSRERKAFNGLALAIVKPKAGDAGEIRVKATSAGLASAEITVRSTQPPEARP